MSEKLVQRYRDIWLKSIGISKPETLNRITDEFRRGEIEMSDNLREVLKSP